MEVSQLCTSFVISVGGMLWIQGGPEAWLMVLLLVLAWDLSSIHSSLFVPCDLWLFFQKKGITWLHFYMSVQAKRQSCHPWWHPSTLTWLGTLQQHGSSVQEISHWISHRHWRPAGWRTWILIWLWQWMPVHLTLEDGVHIWGRRENCHSLEPLLSCHPWSKGIPCGS